VIEGVAIVPDLQRFQWSVLGNFTIRVIATADGGVKRLLASAIKRGARYHRDFGFGKRLLKMRARSPIDTKSANSTVLRIL
jgi:hypothetical protein